MAEYLCAADVLVGALAGYVSVRCYFAVASGVQHAPILNVMIWRELVFISVIAALAVRRREGPEDWCRGGLAGVMSSTLHRAAYAALTLVFVGLVTRTLSEMSRLWLLLWAAGFLTWLFGSRTTLLLYCLDLQRRGGLRRRIAIVGDRAAADDLRAALQAGADILGFAELDGADHARDTRAFADIVALARHGTLDLVVLALSPGQRTRQAGTIIAQLKATPVQIAVCADTAGMRPASREMLTVAGVAMNLVADRPLSQRDLLAKTVFDKCGALVLMVLASPLIVTIAVAIVMETSGPIIFRQHRTGRYGRLFTVYKFRTMRHPAGCLCQTQTVRGDPRCTRLGAFLRRSSLDELPQLWNVLRGEMSLVGPRPHADKLHAQEQATPFTAMHYAQRQRVKPGLTGWAQVHGLRGAADTPEKLRRRVELDLYYIEHWSMWLDLRILLRTPLIVLSAENAY